MSVRRRIPIRCRFGLHRWRLRSKESIIPPREIGRAMFNHWRIREACDRPGCLAHRTRFDLEII